MGVVRNPLSLNEGKHMRSDTHRGVINRDAGQRGIRASDKKEKKKGNANQLESLFALKPLSLFPLITCSLKVIRPGYKTTTVVSSLSFFFPGSDGQEDTGQGPSPPSLLLLLLFFFFFFLFSNLISVSLGLFGARGA